MAGPVATRYRSGMDIRAIRKHNLLQLVEQAGSQREFADRTGLVPAHVSQMVTGRRNVGEDVARRIEEALHLPRGWMDMMHDKVQEVRAAYMPDLVRIPIYDVEASAGAGAFADHEPVRDSLLVRRDWLRQIVGHLPVPEHLAIIEVRGDSMEPTLSPGDLVLVERRTFARHEMADGIYVIRLDGALLVKRVQIVPGGLRLISDNAFYQAQTVEDAEVLARVFWAWHGKRL